MITEGTSSNAWMVSGDGALVTRSLDKSILAGVTREAVLSVAAERQMTVEQRSFSVIEAQEASEAFVTSSTSFVMPVTEIDGCIVDSGAPGPVTTAVIEAHRAYVAHDTASQFPTY